MTIGMAPSARPHKSHGLAKPKAKRPFAESARNASAVTSCSPRALHTPRQEGSQCHVERPVRADERVIHPEVAAAGPHFAEKVLELALIGPPQRARLGRLFDQFFQAAKPRRFVEGKILLGRIDDLQHADVVATMAKVLQAR